MKPCKRCRSYAINHNAHGRDGSDPDLCDVCYWRVREETLQQQLAAAHESEALAKQVAIQSQEDAKNQYQKCVGLEKFIDGKNGYKERIQQLYEENLRLGNEQIDLADKVREECALEAEKQAKDEPYGHAAFRCENIAAAIRAMKERP